MHDHVEIRVLSKTPGMVEWVSRSPADNMMSMPIRCPSSICWAASEDLRTRSRTREWSRKGHRYGQNITDCPRISCSFGIISSLQLRLPCTSVCGMRRIQLYTRFFAFAIGHGP